MKSSCAALLGPHTCLYYIPSKSIAMTWGRKQACESLASLAVRVCGAQASLASGLVDVCLIPEEPFELEVRSAAWCHRGVPQPCLAHDCPAAACAPQLPCVHPGTNLLPCCLLCLLPCRLLCACYSAASFVPAALPPPLCLLLCRLLCACCPAASLVPAALPPPWCLLLCRLLGSCYPAASLVPAALQQASHPQLSWQSKHCSPPATTSRFSF